MDKYASVLDNFKQNLDPSVWDITKDPPIMQKEVSMRLTDQFITFLKIKGATNPESWTKFYLIGSAATYQWTPKSDIDVTVLVENPEIPLEQLRKYAIFINGQTLPGTQHIVTYFVRDDHLPDSDAIYDITNGIWEKFPGTPDVSYDSKKYWTDVWDEAVEMARGWDLDGGEVKRRLVDINKIRESINELPDDQLHEMKFKLIANEAMAMASILDMMDEYDTIHDLRRAVFELPDDLEPEEVIRFSSSWMPINILYKVLERYGYIQLMRVIKDIENSRGTNTQGFFDELLQLFDPQNFTTASSGDEPRIEIRKYLKKLYGKSDKVANKFIQQLTRRFKKTREASDKITPEGFHIFTIRNRGALNDKFVDEIYYKLINEGDAIWSDRDLANQAKDTEDVWQELYDATSTEDRYNTIMKIMKVIVDHPFLAERVLYDDDSRSKFQWSRILTPNSRSIDQECTRKENHDD